MAMTSMAPLEYFHNRLNLSIGYIPYIFYGLLKYVHFVSVCITDELFRDGKAFYFECLQKIQVYNRPTGTYDEIIF